MALAAVLRRVVNPFRQGVEAVRRLRVFLNLVGQGVPVVDVADVVDVVVVVVASLWTVVVISWLLGEGFIAAVSDAVLVVMTRWN